jgi:DNA-binding transcriptional regulator/RsmH inhibitor MraZ
MWAGAANKSSPAWAALCARLQHLPAIQAPLDDRRVLLPREYRDALHELSQQTVSNWLIAFRDLGMLALVPQFLWDEYLEKLTADVRARNLYSPNYFQITFVDSHRPAAVDSRGRLLIPVDMFPLLKQKAPVPRDPSDLVIRPEQAYLELLNETVYGQEQKDALVFMAPYFAATALTAAPVPPQSPKGKSAVPAHTLCGYKLGRVSDEYGTKGTK